MPVEAVTQFLSAAVNSFVLKMCFGLQFPAECQQQNVHFSFLTAKPSLSFSFYIWPCHFSSTLKTWCFIRVQISINILHKRWLFQQYVQGRGNVFCSFLYFLTCCTDYSTFTEGSCSDLQTGAGWIFIEQYQLLFIHMTCDATWNHKPHSFSQGFFFNWWSLDSLPLSPSALLIEPLYCLIVFVTFCNTGTYYWNEMDHF